MNIKNITRTVILDAKYLGENMTEDGQKITKWQIGAIIKRSDFGLKLSRVKELFADDKVKIDIEAEFLLLKDDSQ